MRNFVLKTKTKTRPNFSSIYLIEQLTNRWMQVGKQHLLLPLFSVLLFSTAMPVLSGAEMYANTTDKDVSTYFIDSSVKDIQSFIQTSNKEFKNTFQLFSHGKPGELYIEGEWKDAGEIADWLFNHLALSEVEESPIHSSCPERSRRITHLNIYYYRG